MESTFNNTIKTHKNVHIFWAAAAKAMFLSVLQQARNESGYTPARDCTMCPKWAAKSLHPSQAVTWSGSTRGSIYFPPFESRPGESFNQESIEVTPYGPHGWATLGKRSFYSAWWNSHLILRRPTAMRPQGWEEAEPHRKTVCRCSNWQP